MQDPERRWDAVLIQKAAGGAALLHIRDAVIVQRLTEHAVGRGAPRLPGRTALALTDLIYGAHRQARRRYEPDGRTRATIAHALTYAAANHERRWTAFECWQICRLLPQLNPGVSNGDFTHVAQHTVWAEHTQRRQGTLAWEAVFTNCKTFVSRMHGLQRSRAPRGVLYAFFSAAAQLPGFFDEVEPRDTVTLLCLLIQCTGLDDLVTVRPPPLPSAQPTAPGGVPQLTPPGPAAAAALRAEHIVCVPNDPRSCRTSSARAALAVACNGDGAEGDPPARHAWLMRSRGVGAP